MDEVKFRSHVRDNGECHVWNGVLTDKGYGRFKHRGTWYRAHRVSYLLYVGDPGDGQVLHTCDNRSCVNPDHLYLGDPDLNMKDMVTRRRFSKKLSDDDVLFIRDHYTPRHKDYGRGPLAKRFGVSTATIYNVIRRKTWDFY